MSFRIEKVYVSALVYFQIIKHVADNESSEVQGELFGVYRENGLEVTRLLRLVQREEEEKQGNERLFIENPNDLSKFNLDLKRVGWFSSRRDRSLHDLEEAAALFHKTNSASVVVIWDELDAQRGAIQPLKAYLFQEGQPEPFVRVTLQVKLNPLDQAFLQQFKMPILKDLQPQCPVSVEENLLRELQLFSAGLASHLDQQKEKEASSRKAEKLNLQSLLSLIEQDIALQTETAKRLASD